MSDIALAALQSRVEALTAENTTLKGENKDRRIRAKALATQVEDLTKQLGTLTTERDGFKTKAEAGPAELNATIADLQGKLRSRDHRDAFAGVKEFEAAGKKYKLNEGVTIDALWKQLDYKAEGETPDAKVVSTKLGEAVTAHPYLFAEATAPAPGGATRPLTVQGREAGPGGGKGESPTVNASLAGAVVNTAGRTPGRI